MIADLFESDGWQVRFLGGGLSNDDIFEYINEYAPDVLLVYGTTPKQAPDIRRLIDRVRSVNAWPDMRIVVSGGLFNRAEGLWEEIGADGFAATAAEVLQVAADEQPVPGADRRTVNRRKRRQQTAVQEVVHAE
jgi:methanogenic corrinoid protein MtbC1